MARLKELEEAFFRARAKALSLLRESSPPFIFGFPREEVFRRGEVVGSKVLVYERLARGMDRLRQLLRTKAPPQEGTTVVALSLSEARGRFRRRWFAGEGGLWFSFMLYDDFLPELRGWLPLLVGCALAEAVRGFSVPATLKWVNDLMLSGRKLCGVLTEGEQVGGESWLLVGVGLNVNNDPPPFLPAISLKAYLGRELPLTEVFGKVCASLVKYYGLFRAYEVKKVKEPATDLPLAQIFSAFADCFGRLVAFSEDLSQGVRVKGRALGLDDRGRLILEAEDGEKLFLSSGEIIYLD